MRVLVTGSRTWTDVDEVEDALNALYLKWVEQERRSGPFTVVHGGAVGADRIAHRWAFYMKGKGVKTEVHPYWTHLGRAGGPARNRHMVSLGADYVLGFVKDRSSGAMGCLRVAREAGLYVIEHHEESDMDKKQVQGKKCSVCPTTLDPDKGVGRIPGKVEFLCHNCYGRGQYATSHKTVIVIGTVVKP